MVGAVDVLRVALAARLLGWRRAARLLGLVFTGGGVSPKWRAAPWWAWPLLVLAWPIWAWVRYVIVPIGMAIWKVFGDD